MATITSAKATVLTTLSFGNVLEYGFGLGRSSQAMINSPKVLSVLSWENDSRFIPKNPPIGVTVIGGQQPLNGNFDFVFIDHFVRSGNEKDRVFLAKHWHETGAMVVVDDVGFLPIDESAEIIEGMWILR